MKKKFTKIVAAAAALCLGVCLLAGCSSSESSSEGSEGSEATTEETTQEEATDETATDEATDVQGAATTNTLIVGLDNAYPPYGFVGDDGELTGLDIDLANEVASRNGWEVQFEAIDWDAKDALLNQGTINCIWNGFTMEGREDDYTFSEPYMLNEQVICVKADSGIATLEDLAGKNVITQVDSAALDVLSDEEGQKALADTFGDLQQISDYNNAFMQLESGAVDAVACDLSIANYQMAAKPDTFVQLEPLSSEHYAVGFKKGDDATAQAVNDTLKAMYEDGTVGQLCEKWADYGITIDNWTLK